MPFEELDPLIRIRKLETALDDIQKQIKRHIGYQPGAQSANNPHPQLSAISRGSYSVTNGTTDRAYDANTVAIAELADIVYTMIVDLQTIGILG